MAPTRPGGRPKNAWTPSRKRKLVRLYTLTTLDLEEIRNVLKAHDFNPGTRDMQKRLRELFARDYTTDYRNYRPSNDRVMVTRLCTLRPRRSTPVVPTTGAGPLRLLPSTCTPAEPTAIAFRGYRGSDGISLPARETLSDPLADAELVTPSLLLLDGSSIPSTSMSKQLVCNRASMLYSDPDCEKRRNIVFETVGTPAQESLTMSLRNLRARLGQRSKYPLQHINDILRYSTSESWRSSISWISWRSLSLHSKEAHSDDIAEPHFPSWGSIEAGLRSMAHLFDTPDKIDDWPELINKNVSDMWPRLRLDMEHTFFRPARRRCCLDLPQNWEHRCFVCGSTLIHRSLTGSTPDPSVCYKTGELKEVDFFGCGMLHFAAFSYIDNTPTMFNLILQGADINCRNMKGQTFLHILFYNITFNKLPIYFHLLRYLANAGFNFGSRDNEGRTILHPLFAHYKDSYFDDFDKKSLAIEELFGITRPTMDMMDNQGRTLCYYVHRATNYGRRGRGPMKRAKLFFSAYSNSTLHDVSFRESIALHSHAWEAWISIINGCFTWVDVEGATPLIAMLASWRACDDDLHLPSLIRSLASPEAIDIRDRTGNPALGIAAAKGLRPAVQTLLSLGASIHFVRYDGNGLLKHTKSALREAQSQGHEATYSRILSCIALLSDQGIVSCPTLLLEFSTPWAILHATSHETRMSAPCDVYMARTFSQDSMSSSPYVAAGIPPPRAPGNNLNSAFL